MIDRLISRKKATELTGLSLAQLNDLCHKGIIRIVKINQRVYRIPESDLDNLTARIQKHNMQEALADLDNRSGISREVEEGLRRIYGYVPGLNSNKPSF